MRACVLLSYLSDRAYLRRKAALPLTKCCSVRVRQAGGRRVLFPFKVLALLCACSISIATRPRIHFPIWLKVW
jgi:hypothetical protein